ncbi:hypothetical protein EDC94DRAFT_512136 [Helicostylum pulchrum]|uniref:Uncharacterized protein n=1 Tax=Helicostylum pulchrum TaxID=562976 RepID=A0ABP9XYS3_9FUNG|nr:hypothetical protein EDC94DRAFT_512136 [Helicostylum pulchrum]
MSHKGSSEISHAEAALGAGRPYENSHEGHNKMFDSFKDLEEYNKTHFGHEASKSSRGERIDQELAEEDKETVEKMNEAHKQKEEAKQHNNHNKD